MIFTWQVFARIAIVAGLVVICGNSSALAQSANLPPCNMDSFVYQSGMSDAIYGDEGVGGPPPMMGFSQGSRIASGLYGQNSAGLTTGHGSYLPDAWGADEFVDNEWDMTGATTTNHNYPPPTYAPTGTFGASVYGAQGQYSGSTLITLPVNGQLSLNLPSSPAAGVAAAAGAAVGASVGN
ncbi:MAG: hypothetical protein KGS72_00185 [Cyanobacteria bacterium REEB67]|nr:hypothetical protein [Cyanobacteria bacterium REEB67]